MTRSFLLPAVVVLASLGCKEEPAKVEPPPAAVSASPKPSASASAAPVVSAPVVASASAKPAHSETCEVELFGKVVFPPKLPKGGKFTVYVAQNDCLADNAEILGHVEAGMDGAIVIEVFPKWGTDITICAARDAGEGKPTTLYGKAKGTFHAEAAGEVTFNDVKIELAEGKAHVFPKDASDFPPSKAPTGKGSGGPPLPAAPSASASK